MNGDHTERLSQESKRHQDSESSILESASAFAQRVLEEIEALAGTTACKSVQLVRLLKQPFIADARLATKEETYDEFLRLGFHPDDQGEYYTNGQHDIFDAVDGNVLIDDEGNIFFIDTIIYPADTGGYDTYRSLSPRCSK